MPAGYDYGTFGVTFTTTTAVMANFLTSTTASRPSCAITSVWAGIGGNNMVTAGGGYFEGNTWQTVGTQTTTVTPNKKNTNFGASQVAVCSIKTAASLAIGTGTQTQRVIVHYAQTGGPGFWMATMPDMAWTIPQGGTVTGYGDFLSATASASQTGNFQIEWTEQ